MDATVGHPLMSFLDAFQGYHQIPLALDDQEKTAFVTPIGNYHYKKEISEFDEATLSAVSSPLPNLLLLPIAVYEFNYSSAFFFLNTSKKQ